MPYQAPESWGPKHSHAPSPAYGGYSPDSPPHEAGFAGTPGRGGESALAPSPAYGGYSPDFAGESLLRSSKRG